MNITEEIAQKIIAWIESAGDFVIEQAPLVAREIINYGLFKGWIGFTIGAIILCFGLTQLLRSLLGKLEDEAWFPASLFFSTIGSVIMLSSTLFLAKIYIAPKLFVLHALKHLY